MKTQIAKYFSITLIVIVLLLLIFTPKDCSGGKKETVVKTRVDTIWKTRIDTITKKVPVYLTKYVTPKGKQYTISEDIDTCKARFGYLLRQHSKRTVYLDTIRFDSLGVKGTLTVRDTIWLNKFKGKRQYISNLQFPTIEKTITITKTADPVRQLYIGGTIFGDANKIQMFAPGLVYKTKKDLLIQGNIGIIPDGTVVYGGGIYYKINLRKSKK